MSHIFCLAHISADLLYYFVQPFFVYLFSSSSLDVPNQPFEFTNAVLLLAKGVEVRQMKGALLLCLHLCFQTYALIRCEQLEDVLLLIVLTFSYLNLVKDTTQANWSHFFGHSGTREEALLVRDLLLSRSFRAEGAQSLIFDFIRVLLQSTALRLGLLESLVRGNV